MKGADELLREERRFLGMVFTALLVAALLAWAMFTPPEACAWGCGGHICVEDFDCPKACSCARIPWEPSGECV